MQARCRASFQILLSEQPLTHTHPLVSGAGLELELPVWFLQGCGERQQVRPVSLLYGRCSWHGGTRKLQGGLVSQLTQQR